MAIVLKGNQKSIHMVLGLPDKSAVVHPNRVYDLSFSPGPIIVNELTFPFTIAGMYKHICVMEITMNKAQFMEPAYRLLDHVLARLLKGGNFIAWGPVIPQGLHNHHPPSPSKISMAQ